MGERDRLEQALTPPILALEALVAGYTHPVVGPVDVTVPAGGIVGLVGPNGCGKSTVIASVVGLARIFSGLMVRRPGTRVAVQQQRPERAAEMPLTGREYLRLTGADRQPVPDAVAPLLALRVDRLSGGQFQMLHVWACLGSPVDLVLLDEPTNNMDATAVNALQGLLAATRVRGVGVVVVSHSEDFINAVSTSVVRLVR